MTTNDFYSFLNNDLEEAENIQLARIAEEEKAMFAVCCFFYYYYLHLQTYQIIVLVFGQSMTTYLYRHKLFPIAKLYQLICKQILPVGWLLRIKCLCS